MSEYVTVRDLRLLAYLASRGKASASELAEKMDAWGSLYGSLNRLIVLGYVNRPERGVYEITEKGLRFLEGLTRELQKALGRARG